MEQAEKVLLDTIKKALFEAEAHSPADTDWSAVLKEAKMQTVFGIAVQGVPAQVRAQRRSEELSGVANYARILFAHRELVDLFDQQGIPVAILKGMAAAVYYPNPSVRSFGDIDCIVPQDRFEEARRALEDNGYARKEGLDDERHVEYIKNGVLIELHHHYSHEDLDLEEFIAEGLQHIRRLSVDGVPIPLFPKRENGIVLLAHMQHHLKSGMGLRQIIDWMMYAHSELDDSFWQESFEAAASRIGLSVLAKTATKMCQMYLGLEKSVSWCADADKELCEDLMDCLLSSGNFGRKHGRDGQAETVVADMRRIGVFRKLQRSGQINWKAYRKHPWLKPFCWAYQIFRYGKQWIQNRKDIHFFEDAQRADRRMNLLKKLGILQG